MPERRHARPAPASQLAIKLSTSSETVDCALCGQACQPYEGPELFLADVWQLVCWDCGVLNAPELVDMLDVFWESIEEVAALEQASGRPTA